ncbi:MAG: hypothetical protein ACOX5G_02520 [Kiritimatiellia bacterium]|jgi:hypothetical protein
MKRHFVYAVVVVALAYAFFWSCHRGAQVEKSGKSMEVQHEQDSISREECKMLYAEDGVKVLAATAQFTYKIVEVNGCDTHVIEGRFIDTVTGAVLSFKFDAMGRVGLLLENGCQYIVVVRESKGEEIREGHIIALLKPKDSHQRSKY